MKIGIAIFAYNRPSHLKRLLIALEDYNIKAVSAFIDGPKNRKDKLIQEQIFFMLKNNKKIKINIFLRKKNLGLAKSLMLGLSYMSKKYPFFIVLEDDVVPYKNFFKFINLNYKKFEENKKIGALCAYQLPEINKKIKKEICSTYFDFFIPWGWGTWSVVWKKFENFKVNKKIINESKNINIYFKKFLLELITKKKNSIWSARFILFNLLNNYRFIYPTHSLTKNIGFDGSGINSKITNQLNVTDGKNKKINFSKIYFDPKLQKTQHKILKKKLELFY
jgi:hypothetical protein